LEAVRGFEPMIEPLNISSEAKFALPAKDAVDPPPVLAPTAVPLNIAGMTAPLRFHWTRHGW